MVFVWKVYSFDFLFGSFGIEGIEGFSALDNCDFV